MLLSQEQIDCLLKIGESHVSELMASSPARTSASEAEGEGVAPSTPAIDEAGCSSERVSL